MGRINMISSPILSQPRRPQWTMTASVVILLMLSCSGDQCRATAAAAGDDDHEPSNNNTLSFDMIYQFGDSYSDTGNFIRDNIIGLVSPFTRLPYGRTYFGKATGRCSDGRLIVDFYAEMFGLPFLSAYREGKRNFTHGVCFSVAGATALDIFSLGKRFIITGTASSVGVQLQWFRNFLKRFSICNMSGPTDCKEKFNKTLFIVGEIGENDYNYGLVLGKSLKELHAIIPNVVKSITHVVTEVIKNGASSLFVPGIYPLGCLPIHLTLRKSRNPFSYDEFKCLKELNDLSRAHNDQLQAAIRDLRGRNPGIKIGYGDYYNGLIYLFKNAKALGFEEETKLIPCCGYPTGDYKFNLLHPCGTAGTKVCKEPKKAIQWDGVHMTEQAHLNLAKFLLNDMTRQFNTTG